MPEIYDDFTIATGIKSVDRIITIATYFEDRSGTSEVSRHSFDEILTPGAPLSRAEAEALFTGLRRNGVATEIGSAQSYADYRFSVEAEPASDVLAQQAVACEFTRQHESNVSNLTTAEIITTLPSHIDELSSTYRKWRRHSSSLRSMLLDADERIRIAMPYFDTAEVVIDDIASLPNRGIETQVLTREVVAGSQSTAESINRIYEEIDSENRNRFAVRDLYKLDNDSGRQTYATHAKAIVADDELCYLGSANMTSTSLGSNFELGVLLTGPNVAVVTDIYDTVFEASVSIDLPIKTQSHS